VKWSRLNEDKYTLLYSIYNTYSDLTIPKCSSTSNYYGVMTKGNEDIVFNHETEIATINKILKESIDGFISFSNFTADGRVRFQYKWDERFSGVGYLHLKSDLKMKGSAMLKDILKDNVYKKFDVKALTNREAKALVLECITYMDKSIDSNTTTVELAWLARVNLLHYKVSVIHGMQFDETATSMRSIGYAEKLVDYTVLGSSTIISEKALYADIVASAKDDGVEDPEAFANEHQDEVYSEMLDTLSTTVNRYL